MLVVGDKAEDSFVHGRTQGFAEIRSLIAFRKKFFTEYDLSDYSETSIHPEMFNYSEDAHRAHFLDSLPHILEQLEQLERTGKKDSYKEGRLSALLDFQACLHPDHFPLHSYLLPVPQSIAESGKKDAMTDRMKAILFEVWLDVYFRVRAMAELGFSLQGAHDGDLPVYVVGFSDLRPPKKPKWPKDHDVGVLQRIQETPHPADMLSAMGLNSDAITSYLSENVEDAHPEFADMFKSVHEDPRARALMEIHTLLSNYKVMLAKDDFKDSLPVDSKGKNEYQQFCREISKEIADIYKAIALALLDGKTPEELLSTSHGWFDLGINSFRGAEPDERWMSGFNDMNTMVMSVDTRKLFAHSAETFRKQFGSDFASYLQENIIAKRMAVHISSLIARHAETAASTLNESPVVSRNVRNTAEHIPSLKNAFVRSKSRVGEDAYAQAMEEAGNDRRSIWGEPVRLLAAYTRAVLWGTGRKAASQNNGNQATDKKEPPGDTPRP